MSVRQPTAAPRAALRLAPLTEAALLDALPALARLRISVFADWPYLYEGDPDYEARYLRAYAHSADALVVGAYDGDRLVGAATAAPMEDHAAEFGQALAAAGLAPGETLYFGESVLDPAYRGLGVGRAFFEAREAHARALGRRWCAFCAVLRDPDDPRRPPHHRPLDAFWTRRGYAKTAGAEARFRWREIGAAEETEHRMALWLRETPAG
ncbi:MAG: GNAT family N-acetyltransferase [Rubrimonas sp.]|uniref:GNAT family N-acetyltransferase n=1 Tax=Rubrimonas sp. TaxID=2036015 RepID=UPI002FDD9BEC